MKGLLEIIRKRQSERIPFDPERRIARDDLRMVLEAGRWSPTAHNMQNFEVIVVEDRKLLEAIANIDYPTSMTFIRENYRQLSFSTKELLQKKVGILGTMFPPSWRKPDVTPEEVAQDEPNPFIQRAILASAALLMVLYDPDRRAPASEGDFLGIMSLGCVMENMWLMAHSLGIGCHVVSSLSSSGTVAKEIKELLHIPDNLIIAFTLRLGYPVTKKEYLRVRRDLDEFTHYDRFDDKGK